MHIEAAQVRRLPHAYPARVRAPTPLPPRAAQESTRRVTYQQRLRLAALLRWGGADGAFSTAWPTRAGVAGPVVVDKIAAQIILRGTEAGIGVPFPPPPRPPPPPKYTLFTFLALAIGGELCRRVVHAAMPLQMRRRPRCGLPPALHSSISIYNALG